MNYISVYTCEHCFGNFSLVLLIENSFVVYKFGFVLHLHKQLWLYISLKGYDIL